MFNSGASFGRLSFSTPDQPQSANRNAKGGRSSTGVDSGIYSSAAVEKRNDVTADPPCIPVTCGLLYNAASKGNFDSGKCMPYSDVQCGVVVVAGWVHTAPLQVDDGSTTTNITFALADGTSHSALQIIFDEIQSENSVWMTERIMSVATQHSLVRIVGQPLTQDGELKLRGIHITSVDADDWGYFHTLNVLHVYLQSTMRFDKAHGAAHDNTGTSNYSASVAMFDAHPADDQTAAADENRSAASATFELPAAFSNVTDACARHIVRFILDHRKADIGASLEQIAAHLQNKYTGKDIKDAIEQLQESGDAFETLDKFYDVLTQ